MGGRGSSSGVNRGYGTKQENKNTKTFKYAGLGKISPEAVKAVFDAPAGTRIHAKYSGFGTSGTSDYEITLRGMTTKMLSYQHKLGEGYHRPLVLSKANIKKLLRGAELTLEY